CRRRRIRVALVPTGKAGRGTRNLWPWQYRSVRCRVLRAGTGLPDWLAEHFSRHGSASGCLGRSLLLFCSKFSEDCPSRRNWCDAAALGARASILAAFTFLLLDVRRIRRVLDLSAGSSKRPVRVETR